MAIEHFAALVIRILGILVLFDCSLVALNMTGVYRSMALSQLGASFEQSMSPAFWALVSAFIIWALLAFSAVKMIMKPKSVCKTCLPFKTFKKGVSRHQKLTMIVKNMEMLGVFVIGGFLIYSALLYQDGIIGVFVDFARFSMSKNLITPPFSQLVTTCAVMSLKLGIGLFLVFQTQRSIDFLKFGRNGRNQTKRVKGA